MPPSRPHVTHSLSAQFRLHRPSRDERTPLLAPSRRASTAPLTANANESTISEAATIPQITFGDSDVEEEESEHADSDGLYPPHCCWTAADGRSGGGERSDPFRTRECNVYLNIHRIRRDIQNSIDDPYSLEQLKAPRMNISVVRPLVDEYYSMQDLSIVYCLLVNRMQFIREQSFHSHHQTVNLTRALLCELLAEKILRRYNEHCPGPKGLLKLATILVAGFEAFQNAPDEVIEDTKHNHAMHWVVREQAWGDNYGKLTALEVAIVSESKSFLASSACQKVVDAIYRGKVVYSPNSFIDIIPDRWKKRPISLYDPRRGPRLNQYRLIVPRTRNVIELVQFAILLVLYFLVMTQRESRLTTKYEVVEAVFDVYAAGWVLDQVASILEHGWQVYTQNLWSFLDVMFSTIFVVYLVMRLHALNISDEEISTAWARTSLDVLCCGAPLLVPRLAFNVMSENMLFVSLRAMMSDFITLTILAFWSFAGFLLSLKWLHNGVHHSLTIGKWMIWIWFGLDGTGIDEAPDFHWFLGPALMILFAFLGNTLFLTILVSMLSNTFSIIVKNAVQEIQFRRAVLTFEGVKSDAIFAYMPPFNILALVILLPLKLILSPRMFHKVNVACVRVINLPALLFISWYERRTLWITDKHKHLRPAKIDWTNPFGPRVTVRGWWSRTLSFWDFSRFSAHGDIQAVFDLDPPQSVIDTIEGQDGDHSRKLDGRRDSVATQGGIGKRVADDFYNQFGLSVKPSGDSLNLKSAPGPVKDKRRRRRTSSLSPSGSDSKPRKSKLQPSSTMSQSLKKEFQDSGSDGEDESSHPHSHRKIKRGERMDSIIDFNDTNTSMQEANARLHRLETGMQRIEAMMAQIVDGGGDPEQEHEDGQEALEEEMETGDVPE